MSYTSSIILIRSSLVKPFANKVFSFLTFKIPYAILIRTSTKSDLREERDEMKKQPKFRKELLKFNQINKELNDIYDAFMRQEKMSHSEFDILYSLCELGEGCTQHDICSVSWLPKQTVNSSIRKLEQKGLIQLLPGRGRERHIHPTQEGKEWIRQKIYPVIQAENNAFAVLEEDECQKMLQTFAKYRDEMRGNMLDNIRT